MARLWLAECAALGGALGAPIEIEQLVPSWTCELAAPEAPTAATFVDRGPVVVTDAHLCHSRQELEVVTTVAAEVDHPYGFYGDCFEVAHPVAPHVVLESAPTLDNPDAVASLHGIGEDAVWPPYADRVELARRGKQAHALIEVCVDDDPVGVVRIPRSATLLQSTGLPGYDATILAAARGWRFTKHSAGCGLLGFVYQP